MTGRLRRLAGRIGRWGARRRPDGRRQLNPAQRVWLLDDIREDLAAMFDDAENRGITERATGEMLVIRALADWLEGGEPPGAEAMGYLGRLVKAIPHNPGEGELARRDVYLAAIGDLGDEEAAGGLRREEVDERTRPLLDLQGRRLRGRMEELGLTTGELARRSGIDAARLVGLLSGQVEIGAVEWIGLSEALDVSPDWMVEGIRFVPLTGPEGRAFYEVEPQASKSDGLDDAADGLGGDPPDDARPLAGGGDEKR